MLRSPQTPTELTKLALQSSELEVFQQGGYRGIEVSGCTNTRTTYERNRANSRAYCSQATRSSQVAGYVVTGSKTNSLECFGMPSF